MSIKASDLMDELTLAHQVLKATTEAWPGKRIEQIAAAIENAVGADQAGAAQRALFELATGAENAMDAAWSAIEALEEASRIVRAREASGFTV